MDLALNNLQIFMCHKTNQPNKQTNRNVPKKELEELKSVGKSKQSRLQYW